jgi:hypothetical protein
MLIRFTFRPHWPNQDLCRTSESTRLPNCRRPDEDLIRCSVLSLTGERSYDANTGVRTKPEKRHWGKDYLVLSVWT